MQKIGCAVWSDYLGSSVLEQGWFPIKDRNFNRVYQWDLWDEFIKLIGELSEIM